MSNTLPPQEPSQWKARRIGLWGSLVVILATIPTASWWSYRASVLRSLPSQITSAELSLRSGKFAAARDKVAAIRYFLPDQPDALSIMGRSWLEEEQPDVAILALEQIPEDSTAYEKAGFPLATACLQIGDLERAETVLKQYLKHFPAAENAREELRWLCFNQFRTRDVEQILEDRLQMEPGEQKTLADLLDCEYRQQVPYEGAAYLEQINQKRPGQATVSLALGYARWRTGHAEEARSLLRTALAVRPNDPHIRFTVAAFLLEQGQLEDAEKLLNGSPVPDDDRFWSLQSQLAEQKNDPATALVHLDQAIKQHGIDYRYASRRANLLRKLARGKDAAEASGIALKLQQIDRELANIVEAGTHHQTTRNEALRIADLLAQAGKDLGSKHWRILADRAPEGNAVPGSLGK